MHKHRDVKCKLPEKKKKQKQNIYTLTWLWWQWKRCKKWFERTISKLLAYMWTTCADSSIRHVRGSIGGSRFHNFVLDKCRVLTLSDDICRLLFYFNKLSFGKTFVCQVERRNVKQRRSRWDGSMSRSHLDLYCLQKPIFIACCRERVKIFVSLGTIELF